MPVFRGCVGGEGTKSEKRICKFECDLCTCFSVSSGLPCETAFEELFAERKCPDCIGIV